MPLRHVLAAAVLLALVAPASAHAGWTTPEFVGTGFAAYPNSRNGGIGVVAVDEDRFAIKVNSGIHTAFADRVNGVWGSELLLRHCYCTYNPPDSWLRTNGGGTAAFVDAWGLSSGAPLDIPVPGSVPTLIQMGGGTWGPVENVRADLTGNVKSKAPPVVDANGNVTVFWAREESGGTATIWARTKPPGQPWGTPQLILSGATGYSPLGDTAIDDEGRVYVFTSLGLTIRNPATGAWSTPESPSLVPVDIATYADGHLLVLPYAARGTAPSVLERDRDGNWTTHALSPTPEDGIYDLYADLAVAPNGAAAVVWRHARRESAMSPLKVSIRVARRPAGGSWQPSEAVTPEVALPLEDWNDPTVAVGPAGEVRVAWIRYADYTTRLRTAMRPAEGSWGPVEQPARDESAWYPEIAIDPAGTALIVWAAGGIGHTTQIAASGTDGTTADYIALTVSKMGTGTGTVTSEPSGIACGADCAEAYPWGTSVTLTATPDPGSTFAGWGGMCSGMGTCVVSTTAAKSVIAAFAPPPISIPPPAPPPPAFPPPPPPPARPAAPQPQAPKTKPKAVPKKVTLCHKRKTIRVAKSKVKKLRKQGAKLGKCKPKKKPKRR